MPQYEYKCTHCGAITVKIAKHNVEWIMCPEDTCDARPALRIVSLPAKRRDMTIHGDNQHIDLRNADGEDFE